MEINMPCTMIVAGKPKSGKTHFIKWFMLYHSSKFSYGIVFNKTKFNNAYDYIPQNYVHSEYNENIIKNMMKIQTNIIQSGATPPEAFIIFDDCLEQSQFISQTFTDLITQYRHYHISVIISTQYIYKVPPTVRECSQYAVIFRQTTDRSINALHESFGEMYSSNKNDFSKFLKENTGNHQFILFDAYSDADESKDAYRIMKAPAKIPHVQIKYNKKTT